MQAWRIVVTSAVAASIACAALFLPGAVRSPTGALALLQGYWPGVVVVWLGVYSIAALLLSTAAAVRELGAAVSDQTGLDWPRRYLLRLGVTHYFSAVLVLLALGLLPIAISTEPFFPVPAVIGSSLALAACALAILVGVLGWLTATVVAALRIPASWAALPTGPDPQMLQELIELLRTRPVEPGSVTAELVEQARHRDLTTLEAIKELAGAVNRLRNGISEIQRGLQQRGPEQTGQNGSAAPADVADAAGELRAATAAVTAAVTKLEEFAAALISLSPSGTSPPPRGNLPAGSRAQLSTELQELLRDMATAPAPHREDSR
jgi:hypothetical protein